MRSGGSSFITLFMRGDRFLVPFGKTASCLRDVVLIMMPLAADSLLDVGETVVMCNEALVLEYGL